MPIDHLYKKKKRDNREDDFEDSVSALVYDLKTELLRLVKRYYKVDYIGWRENAEYRRIVAELIKKYL